MKLNTLYKRSISGKITEFSMEIEGNKYRTITGFVGMVLTTSSWTECEAKTYCSAEEQALKQAQAIHRKKKELGAFENIDDVDNEKYFEVMLAKDYKKEKKKIKWGKQRVFIQPKLDGLRMISYDNIQQSRNGKIFVSTPHLNQISVILDGEMYNHLLKDNFNEIISLCRKTKPELQDLISSKGNVQYWIYDFPEYDGVFSERYDALKIWFDTINNNPYFKLVPTYEVFNEKHVDIYHETFLEEGYEGSIIRLDTTEYENKRSSSLLKYKEFIDEEYEILAVNEGIGKLQNKAGTFTFNRNGNEFKASINGPHEYLEELWNQRESLIGKQATVKYFNLTPDNIPRFPKIISIRDYE